LLYPSAQLASTNNNTNNGLAELVLSDFGARLLRAEGEPDKHEPPRVLFKPDPWQLELLDLVDRNESALICAPTSSGMWCVASCVVCCMLYLIFLR
jgi:superfamily II RNA helicase